MEELTASLEAAHITLVQNQTISSILDYGVKSVDHNLHWTVQPEKWAKVCANICVITTSPDISPLSIDELDDGRIEELIDILLSRLSFLAGCEGNFRINVGSYQSAPYFHGHYLFNVSAANKIERYVPGDPKAVEAEAVLLAATVAGRDVYFSRTSDPPSDGADMFEVSFLDSGEFVILRQSDGFALDVPANNSDKVILWWAHSHNHKGMRNQKFKKASKNNQLFRIQSTRTPRSSLFLSLTAEGQLKLTTNGQLFKMVERAGKKYLAIVDSGPAHSSGVSLLASANTVTDSPVPVLQNNYFRQDLGALDAFRDTANKFAALGLDPASMSEFCNGALLEHPHFPVFGVRRISSSPPVAAEGTTLLPVELEDTPAATRAATRLAGELRQVRDLLSIVRKGQTAEAYKSRLGFSVFFRVHESGSSESSESSPDKGFVVPHFHADQLEGDWKEASALVVVDPRFMYMYLVQKNGNEEEANAWRDRYCEHGKTFFV